jgi:hypothetical protein
MASGILGQSNPAAATNTTVYTVPSSVVATFNVNITNLSGSAIAVNLAIASTGTPTNSEYLEYQTVIPANGVLERGGIVANTGENVVVNCSDANSSVSVYGFEQ